MAHLKIDIRNALDFVKEEDILWTPEGFSAPPVRVTSPVNQETKNCWQ